MKLLAWDTSSKSGALVALEWDHKSVEWKDVRLVTELTLNVDATHSERLLWGIHQTLEAAQWKLEEIDVFGVGVGPGSFTGLRIGLTTARTLSHTLKKPLVGVSSLAVLARPVAVQFSQEFLPFKTVVIAATDACKGELFAIWGEAANVTKCGVSPGAEQPGLWHRKVEERVLSPNNLMSALLEKYFEKKENYRWVAIGEGRRRYLDEWKLLPRSKEITLELPYLDGIQGRYLGMLVWEAYQAGFTKQALEVHPLYLRASDAEVKLKSGLLKKAGVRGLRP